MRIKKTVFTIILGIGILSSFALNSLAATYTYSYSVPSGATRYTSEKYYASGSIHSAYYVKLNSFKYSQYSLGTMPSGTEMYFRMRYGTGESVGELVTYTNSNKNTAYLPNYKKSNGQYLGVPGKSYKVATNSNANLAYECTIDWRY